MGRYDPPPTPLLIRATICPAVPGSGTVANKKKMKQKKKSGRPLPGDISPRGARSGLSRGAPAGGWAPHSGKHTFTSSLGRSRLILTSLFLALMKHALLALRV